MNPSKATPMIKQYLTVKEAYPDALLFYRMGDFYEMFFEDAVQASRLLEITLTSRNKKAETPIPMCGVPFRSAQSYIARLIGMGHKVAICDQIEDSSLAKGLVKREVVRVITPGMILENELLDEKSNNYVLALEKEGHHFGLATLDISTGSFRVTESMNADAIKAEVTRIAPSEVILPDSSEAAGPLPEPLTAELIRYPLTYIDSSAFAYGLSRERLLSTFQTLSLEGFGCEDMRPGVRAAGALIHYVLETQKQTIQHINRIETYRLEHYLFLDDLSYQNLEIEKNLRTGIRKGTLLGVIDHTVTAMGSRLLKQWLRYPLMDEAEISLRHDAVEEAITRLQLTRDIREKLKQVYDIERLRGKISMGQSNARDLLALKQSLSVLPGLLDCLKDFESAYFFLEIDPHPLIELRQLIDTAIREDAPPTIQEGGIIKTGFDPSLDELIQISRDGKGWLAELEIREKDRTGITALKVRYNKVFGYYLEVPKSRLDAVPAHYIRKQTLVNAERFITDELKSFETKVLTAEDQRATLEYEIFNDIKREIIHNNVALQLVGAFLARLDCLLALGIVAEQNNYVRPEFNLDGRIHIEEGRHPVIEKMITAERFVPNSIKLDNYANQVLIITGPNMAGKSTILRQTALLVIMGQMGSFVPAQRASISITDRIFTRIGALDNLSQGQSTFLVEMQETANILNHATDKSLVIMDEIGRGTSTFDGLSIAWAVAEFIHDLNDDTGVKTLFATHYHELTQLAEQKERIKNFHIAVKEWNEEIIFIRKLVPGGTNRSYGIQVARLAGIPEMVIHRSKKILAGIEKEERSVHRISAGKDPRPPADGRHVQMDLFHSPDNKHIREVKNLDLTRMTPLDAMNFLDAMQEKLKSGI